MKNFLQVNRALVAEKNIYLNLNQLPSKNDGGQSCDGNRQSRLMSQSGCSAVDVPMTSYGAPDEHPMSTRSASDGTRWNSRGWKYVAMIVAVLVMSIANIGTAWGAYDVPANGKVTLSTKVNNDGRFNVEASGVYHFRKKDGYSWSSEDGIKTQSNLSGVIFYLDASTEIEVGIKHTESKNAHDVTVHVYSIPESEYKQFDDNKAGAAENDRTFSTGPSTSSDDSFTISVAAETKTFTGTKTLAAGYYAVVPVGEKSKTFFTSIKFTSGGGGGGGGDECSSPSFSTQPTSASYAVGASATNLTATATATNQGTITYKWQKSTNYGSTYSDIDGATNQTYKPSTSTTGITYYRSVASFSGGCSDTNSDPAIVAVKGSNSGTMSGSDYICFKNKTANNTATSATTSNSTALTSLSGQLTGDGSGDKTAKVTASTGQTYSFTVASGYTFDPTYIGFKGSYVGSGAPTQMTFTYALKNSSSETLCSGTFVQATHANTAPLDTIYKGSIDITPLEAGTYTLKITGSQDKNVANNFRLGNWVTIKGTVASSCSAPTAVYVTQTEGSADMIAGESFTLSAATSTGVEEGATYQWYRNTTEVGTNSPTYTVPSCTKVDAGTYWCKITNPCSSDAHTTNTVGFGIKVWQVLLCESSSWNAYDLTSTGTKTGEVTRQLTPGTYYIKLTHNNGVDFGVNTGETISEITATTPSAWTLYNGQNKIKVTVTTAGDYTFGVDYTSADYPKLSVTYPPSTISSCDKIYFCPTVNSIATGSAKFSIYFYNATTNAWANCYLVSGTEYADDAKYVAYAPAPGGWTGMIVVRYSSYISNWDNKWNQSEDITYNGYNYIVGRNEWTSDNPAKFKTHLNSFYSSTTPAMDESEYCVIVGGTTTASTNLPSSAVTYTSSDETKATVGSTTGVITGVAAGTATITAKVGTCTVGTATVTVYAAPSVALSSSSVTYGASAPTLTPSNFATITGYSSSTTGTATINGSGLISIVAAGTTTFTVTGTDQCGNSVNVTTGTFTVNQATPTKYDFSADNTSICSGSNVTFTLAGSQVGATYYVTKSSSGGSAIGDSKAGTGSALSFTVSSATAGDYYCYTSETTNYNAGKVSNSKVTITHNTATSITTQPTTPVAATVGSACSITGLVAAGTSPTYQWYTCNSDGSSATAIDAAGTLSFTGYTTATLGLTPTATGATYYKCVVSGSCGDPVTSSVVTVNASAAPVGTTYYLVTSTAQLNTTDTYVIMDDGKAAMMGVATDNNAYLNAITSGFTVAGDKSTVTVTSSDVNTLKLKAESTAWNLFGKDSHYITTNSTVSSNLYGNATSGSNTDDFVFSFADGKAIINRPSSSYHIYYSSGTGFNQSTSSTNIRLYTSNSTPVYTVTYNLNGGTGTVPTHRAEKSGTTITLASSAGLTKSGYTFDGWLCNVNSTKYNAGASYTMTAVNTTFTAQWEAVSGYTVTYNYNGATGGATPASATGASVTLPTPTRTGYELDGWYTTAGTKVDNGGETYVPEADITLYARWQEACDAEGVAKSTTDVAATGYTAYQEKGGSNVVFTSAPSLGFKYKDAAGNTINNSTTAVVRNNAYSCQIKSDSGNKGSIKTNSTFSNVDSISFYFAASDKSGCKIAVWCSTDNFSTDSTSLLSATTYGDSNSEFKRKTLAIPSGVKASTLTFKFRFTVTSSGKTCYMDSLKVYSSTSGGSTCYHVYYHGNGAESGYVNDTVSYTAGSKATVLNYNYGRYPLAKAGNDFQGWATSAGGAVAYTAGQKIDITSADVHLYAKWATESSALVTWTMNTNTETWGASATSTTDGTNITSIGTTRTGGGTGSYTGATAKVTMAEAEVTGSAAPSNSANFTFTIGATKQVEISKFDCKVFNVASGNRTYKAQISDGAGNVYNSTNTVAVSTEATLTDASFVFGSGKILRGAVTIRIYAWKTSGSPTEFCMGPDVKFYGTVENYVCADPSAPTISGVSEYVPGQTITLTASHDGENYDNLTTYTWYKGIDWATASGTTPVQAAATGESGYTLTIADCTTGNAGKYWCKVSNGTGCDAHNSEGYDVTVYPTYTITYNLNEGDWGEVKHKDSYTQFDEDYTLPTPTKTGFVFAGWYGTSDFSGLPTVVLGAGSVGDKVYWAKWGASVTISWTVTKVDDKLYRGGGSYSVKAVINQTAWNESYKDQLELTATEGVTLKNVEASVNGESKVQVTADFDITTDLAADATEISFTLNVPADGTYGPKVDEHEETLTSCAGSSTVWNFAYASDDLPTLTNSNAGTEGNKNTLSATTGSGNLYYFAGSSDAFVADKYLKMNGYSSSGTVNSRSVYQNRCFYIDITSNGTLTIQQYADNGNGAPKYVVANTRPLQSDYPSSSVAPTTTGGATYEINVTNYSSGTADRIWVAYPTAKAYIISVTWTPTGGGGTVTPTLTWETDLSSTVDKVTGDADFTHYVTQNKNSLGAITYSSSDETVATVNPTTGKVHIVGAEGTAIITATLAASGCFNQATAAYTISVVNNCIDRPGTISTTDLGCGGIEMTVSGHTALAGVRYQWYKDGVSLAPAAQEATYTTSAAGEYYVIVTNTGTDHCAMASTNTVTVEAKTAISVPTNIVDSWYVKNGRRTPDIALWKTTGVSTFTVKNNADGATIENIGGCTFELKDGIIYLKGTTSTGAAPSGMEAGDLVIKVEVNDECGSNTKTSPIITIHRQASTTYHEIAFVADGGKGMKKDSITVGHGDGTELYEYLDSVTVAGKRLFQLSERNIYWTTDEKAIREEYSQFDAILITDDPSTNTVVKTGDDYKTKGYVNAFGTMVDVRPIFTMEAYVSALKNWGSKGIKGSPESPNPRQYEMRLECKDHEIYKSGLPDPEDGTNVWEEVIDGETFRHVILVDSTKGVYKGVAYNAQTAGKEKPALQGFTGEAAGSLLGLGRISNGSLQAAIERQEEPAARLLVMGINAKALQPTCALTNEGKAVIKNILVYLLKTNMEEVDDCSNYFTGGASGTDTDWNKASNWSKNALPSSEAKVRILAPCVVKNGNTFHVAQVDIATSGTSSLKGSGAANGDLTIEAGGALIVAGKIRRAKAPNFGVENLMPMDDPSKLIINTGSTAQAALIFDNDDAETQATVKLYSLGRKPSSYQYQYFAVPMEVVPVNPAFANERHGGTGIYTYVYSEATSGWTRRRYYDDLFAFEGLGITTKSTGAMEYTMTGNLASTATKEITLTHADKGLNLIGNSWMAPIQIGALAEDNTDANITKTVYIYCAGRDAEGGAVVSSDDTETPGQWLAVPFEAAKFATWKDAGKLSVIPAMQAFEIKVSAEATLTLDYKKVVRGSTNDLNAKLRAPGRRMAANEVTMTNIRVADSKTHTDLSLFEGDRFSEAFDNGWEAEYMNGDGRSAKLYAETETGKMAVVAMEDYEGTLVGFTPGKETEYTFSFMGENNGYYLNDIKLKNSVRISEGETYTFTYEDGDDANRFYISRTAINAPEVATGMENLDAAAPRVQKIIYNDKLYIIRGGRLYDATGKVVK